MTSDTLTQLDALFAESPILRAGDVPTGPEIAEAEREIGVPFVPDYREFLLRYGGAMVGPYPVFGLRPVEVMGVKHWSVVDVTQHYRDDGVPGANQWIVISEDHAGNPVGLDENGSVWIHDHDFGGFDRLARSFEDYLRTWCMKLPDGD